MADPTSADPAVGNAADLPEGVVGPEIGRQLRALEERWIASGFRAGRDDLLG